MIFIATWGDSRGGWHIQVFGEFEQMVELACDESGRHWRGNVPLIGGEPFSLVNREVTITVSETFELEGESISASATHTGLIEVADF